MKANEALALLAYHNLHSFSLEDYCFKEQLSFIHDKSPWVSACCSRRSGKTVACATDLTYTATSTPGIKALYLTLTRVNAKNIVWNDLLKINARYDLKGKPNHSELVIRYPNGSSVHVSGAKDKAEIENFRGQAFKKVYIDEIQSFRSYVSELIDDVLAPTLFDHAGQLRVIGTPGPVPAGVFWDICESPNWSHHGWTMFQNPHIQQKSGLTAQALVQRELQRRGVDIEDPKIQRECFGRWVVDPDALVFRYDAAKNDYQDLPPSEKPWEYILGIDIGFDDADAIAVIGWNPKYPTAYLVEEHVKNKQGISELVSEVERLMKKYDPMKIVMDTGGLGKKIAEELRKRYAIPIQAAEKHRKFEYIEILNDAMRTKNFFAKRSSLFAQDSMLVEWDRDTDLDKPKISDTYHSDICEAVLYGYREALNWLHVPETPKPLPGQPAWFKEQEQIMEQEAEKRWREAQGEDVNEGLPPSDEWWAS